MTRRPSSRRRRRVVVVVVFVDIGFGIIPEDFRHHGRRKLSSSVQK
jgi:hypothetical protein